MGFKVAKRLGSKSNCLTFQFDQIVFTEKEGRCTLRIFASKKIIPNFSQAHSFTADSL